MNAYKKIIKNRNMRVKIIRLFDFVPDKLMISLQYFIKTKHIVHWKHPKRYTEKLQVYKLKYRNPLLIRCSDKYDVREYVKQKGLGSILNELYGCYHSAEEIDFDALPEKFVIKSTAGSGNNILVKDKTRLDVEQTKNTIRAWLEQSGKSLGREWGYGESRPRIIAEKFIERNEHNDLPDYKFFCFDGKVYCLYIMVNYTENHANGQLGFYDRNFQKMPYCRVDYRDIDFEIPKPEGFEKMVEYAEILSKDFPHARVDFYNMNGKITFGEITFYNASGYTKFQPDEFDFILGKKFHFPA